MKDILVSYTGQEKDEATGNYISSKSQRIYSTLGLWPNLHNGHNPQYRRKIPLSLNR